MHFGLRLQHGIEIHKENTNHYVYLQSKDEKLCEGRIVQTSPRKEDNGAIYNYNFWTYILFDDLSPTSRQQVA